MRAPADWGRIFRTARHLTARQIAARALLEGRYRLYAGWPAMAGWGLAGPARLDEAGLARAAEVNAVKAPGPLSPRQLAIAAGAAERRFTFLNRTRPPQGTRVDWEAPDMSRLWQYHLHYADYVAALAQAERAGQGAGFGEQALSLIDDWIDANPAGRRPGWEPYPLSLRVFNWIAALAWLGASVGESRRARITHSLAVQGRFLARHLEWHLGGNHLVKNAKALLALGFALDCPEAATWRARGLRVFAQEIGRQVLGDGGHYERSPHYQAIVLEDVLDVLSLAGARPPLATAASLDELARAGRRMRDWLAAMRHPDGGLALFNDGTIGDEPGPGALLAYAGRVLGGELPADRTMAMSESGYFVARRGEGRGIIDCGAVGPDELPAHAHADTLSFELSWADRRLVVDSGTGEYAMGDLRRYVRSTAAHNTVRIDEIEQSEVWGSHRVGRRARPLGARLTAAEDYVDFAGAHDGYARLGVIHHRHVVATDDAWVVVDELHGRGHHRFESYLHLHPDLRLEPTGPGWRAVGNQVDLRVQPFGAVTCQPGEGWYCPDWGRIERAPVLTLRGESDMPATFGYVLAPRGLDVDVAVEADARGVEVKASVGGKSLQLRSDRCTFSS